MITTSKKHIIIKYFVLVLLLSIPFWVLGAFIDLTKYIPIQLPISALMFFCPMFAAIILTSKNGTNGDLKLLLNRIFDFKKIENKWWLLVAVLLIPFLMYLTYIGMIFLHYDLPKPQIKLSTTIIFTFLFFIGSIGEEVGWTGFITDPLQQRFGALNAALMLGAVWAVWHIIPYLQTHRNATWIVWQCAGTVALRIIMVWLYNKSNKSLFAIIVCHTTINISVNLFPYNGSHYNPFYFSTLLIITAFVIVYFGGLKTLAHYKFIRQ
jgi:membrane protease YdiL (CAAX protease family)